MAYTNFTNCTKEQYETIVYSGGSKNRIKILFNGTEFQNADYYCEKVTIKSRILPNDGSKIFTLDNFISKEVELILHNVNLSNIVDPVRISIGTAVGSNSLGDIYEDVPIGVFNLQDTPKTDKDKITIKLRDNAVKFDFYYDALPLIELDGGTTTKGRILDDICTQAGVTNGVSSFIGDDDVIGIYDNTIKARTYVSYLAEQCGKTPVINRDGTLIFIDYSNLAEQYIPLNVIEKYELGDSYEVERIVYEDAIRKYQTSSDETLTTLYLNSANPYISEESRLTQILNQFSSFEIDSLTTGKVLGNPAIDPYDIIKIYGYYITNEYGGRTFVPDTNTIVATTLATNTLIYKGTMTTEFSTVVGKEARKENISLDSFPALQKYARTNINNLNGTLTLMAGQVDEQGENIKTVQLELTSQSAILNVVGTNIDETSGDVTSVRTSKGYTFDDEGLKIASEDEFNSLTNNTGTYYKDGDIILSQFTKDNSIVKDLVLYGKYYYGVDETINVENFTKDDAMFVAEKFVNDDNEECFGHFVNSN